MRLDTFLVENGFFDSRTKAKESIERGEVYVNDKQVLKASFSVNIPFNENISLKSKNDYVSIGAFKLEKALKDFDFSVENLVCLDLGASTGGFTDCLLQNGAKKVYAVDVNVDILHEKIKNDKRVTSIEKNAKLINPQDFPEDINLVVCDLSFISSTYVLPSIYSVLKDNNFLILLIKPQFEMKQKYHAKNGVIKDVKKIKNLCKNVYESAILNGLKPIKFTAAPKIKDKNREYLILLQKNSEKILPWESIDFENL